MVTHLSSRGSSPRPLRSSVRHVHNLMIFLGALKRGDNRKSKRISNKKPNYKDKVWKNISCLATEVDELENRHSPTPPKQKKNRKSFCTLQ